LAQQPQLFTHRLPPTKVRGADAAKKAPRRLPKIFSNDASAPNADESDRDDKDEDLWKPTSFQQFLVNVVV
jgi:hypothetical protein